MLVGTRARQALAAAGKRSTEQKPKRQLWKPSTRLRPVQNGWSKLRGKRRHAADAQPLGGKQREGDDPVTDGIEPVILELLRVEISQIKSIDQQQQTFGVRVFLQFVIRGGARADSPLEPSGFRSAEWFMNTIRWHNAASQPTELDNRVVKMGDDLHLVLEVEADFFEQMELESFPWDSQECTIVMKVGCANEGSAPVRLTGLDTAACTIDDRNFALSNVFRLEQCLEVRHRQLSPLVGRTYPCLVLTAHLHRRSLYYVFNIIAPMAMFALMTVLMRAVPITQTADRLAISMTMVLTIAAYKSNISTLMPPISYLTLIDKYVLWCFLMVGVIVFWNVLGLFIASCTTDCSTNRRFRAGVSALGGADDVDADSVSLPEEFVWGYDWISIDEARRMDDWFALGCVGAWLVLQLWLFLRVCHIQFRQARSIRRRRHLVQRAQENAEAYHLNVARKETSGKPPTTPTPSGPALATAGDDALRTHGPEPLPPPPRDVARDVVASLLNKLHEGARAAGPAAAPTAKDGERDEVGVSAGDEHVLSRRQPQGQQNFLWSV